MEDLKAIRVIEGTKISHDYQGNDVVTFGYRDLINKRVPSIGIPARQNGLVIIDVDALSEDHRHDGREWWARFSKENGIPKTYTVYTPSGGAHYYFKLPVAVNPATFAPPARLSDGVDVKYNGWVSAPPTAGYKPDGYPADIIEAPPSLFAQMEKVKEGGSIQLEPIDPSKAIESLAKPFSNNQVNELRKRIEWLQTNGDLSRDEWRDGIFSLKAGIADPDVLDELIVKWTMNKSYQPGDEELAREMAQRADTHGGVGPGTVFAILKNVAIREGAPVQASPYTRQEIIDKSKVTVSVTRDGHVKVAPSESNVASLIGAMFDSDTLFHDIRMDNFVFEGRVYSDAELANKLAPMIQSPAYGLGFENIKKSTIAGGIDVLMSSREIDPHRKWLESLQWDGEPRIDSFFNKYAKVKDSEYTRAVSRNLWLALAGRGIEPGVKFDNVIVLEGAEGARKSTLVELLGGDYYMSLASKEDINSPDVLRRMHQSTVVELPELVGLLGKSGEEIKALLATRIDNMRALYSKKGVRRARGFIFMATTNNYRYISDDMGYRRYWPIRIPGGVLPINTDKIKEDKPQLYAEAVHRFKQGEDFWSVPDALRGEITNRRKEEPLTEPVRDIMDNAFGTMKMTEIFRQLEANGYVTKNFSTSIAKRIETALNHVGAEEVMVKGTRCWEMPQPQVVEVPQQSFGASSFI